MNDDAPARWLVLLYQFPKGPDARRVKIWRRLQRIGAVAIKNSVYVLPQNEQTLEDLQWLLTELRDSGADAAILESRFIDGMSDGALRDLFNDARSADYRELREELDAAIGDMPGDEAAATAEAASAGRRVLTRASKRLAEIEAIDYFAAPGADAVEAALRTLAERTLPASTNTGTGETTMAAPPLDDLAGSVWVTRRGVRVDRIASAWLIRRFIDPDARFRFVAGTGYRPRDGEVRFDMFEAEFTHEGDRCTFEVLASLARPGDSGLIRIGEIVHDIDLKDAKFGRPETDGVAALLDGIVAATDDDDERIERGSALFDNLHRSLAGQPA